MGEKQKEGKKGCKSEKKERDKKTLGPEGIASDGGVRVNIHVNHVANILKYSVCSLACCTRCPVVGSNIF